MSIDFQTLRDNWALKYPYPTNEIINQQYQMDRLTNPHNESHHNKKPIRSINKIISDLSYQFADDVLSNQYGETYCTWRKYNDYVEVWGVWKKQ